MELSSFFNIFTPLYQRAKALLINPQSAPSPGGWLAHGPIPVLSLAQSKGGDADYIPEESSLSSALKDYLTTYNRSSERQSEYLNKIKRASNGVYSVMKDILGYNSVIDNLKKSVEEEKHFLNKYDPFSHARIKSEIMLSKAMHKIKILEVKRDALFENIRNLALEKRDASCGYDIERVHNAGRAAEEIRNLNNADAGSFSEASSHLPGSMNAQLEKIVSSRPEYKSDSREQAGIARPQKITKTEPGEKPLYTDDKANIDDKVRDTPSVSLSLQDPNFFMQGKEDLSAHQYMRPVYPAQNHTSVKSASAKAYSLDDILPDTTGFELYTARRKILDDLPGDSRPTAGKIHDSSKDIAGKTPDDPSLLREYTSEVARFVQFRNDNRRRGLDYIVKNSGSYWIRSAEDAVLILKSALSQGFYLSRYDARLSSQEMKHEMLEAYCLDTSKSLKSIVAQISAKYRMNVSETTLRSYAKKVAGLEGDRISRQDGSAREAYLKMKSTAV